MKRMMPILTAAMLCLLLFSGAANAALYDYTGELTIRNQDLNLRDGHFLDGYELQGFSGQFEIESNSLTLFTFSISNTQSTYDYSHSGEPIAFDNNANAYLIPVSGDPYAFFRINASSNHTLTIYDRSDTDSPYWYTEWTSSRHLNNFTYDLAPVPVPGALLLLGSGLLGAAGIRYRSKTALR